MKECSFCDFTSLRSSYLNRHIKSFREGLKYRCEQEGCHFEAVKKETVRDHIRAVHEGARFKCDECDFESTKPQNI